MVAFLCSRQLSLHPRSSSSVFTIGFYVGANAIIWGYLEPYYYYYYYYYFYYYYDYYYYYRCECNFFICALCRIPFERYGARLQTE